MDNAARAHAIVLRLLHGAGDVIDDLLDELEQVSGSGAAREEAGRLLAAAFPLVRESSKAPELRRVAGQAYLEAWASNRSLLKAVAPVVESLREAGCQPVALKGVALLVSLYGDLGVRRVGDLDVLVDARRADVAWRILEDAGGRPEPRGRLAGFSAIHSAHHAWHFDLGHGTAVDLHWSPFSDCCSPAAAERFLVTARPVDFHGFAVLVPSRENLLLHACVHGAHRDLLVPGRWMVDATTIVAATPDLNWNLVWAGARAAGLEHALDAALRRIDAVVGLPPARHLGRSSDVTGPWQRLELWAWHRDVWSFAEAPLARLVSHVSRYRRLRRFHPDWRNRGLADFYRQYRLEKPGPNEADAGATERRS